MSLPWESKPNGTMKAAVLTSPGAEIPSACFTYREDYPRPSLPGPDWVLVRVRATGINRAELRARSGAPSFEGEFNIFQQYYRKEPPSILGEELVGEVVDAGLASGFKVGDKVAAANHGGGKAHDGGYAEYAVCHKRRTFHLPQDTKLPWEVLGALPMSLLTAYGMVMTSGQLGKKPNGAAVLVHGATSSVGVYALLIAKSHGAKVLATTRQKEKVNRLKELGADHVLLEDELDGKIPELFPNGFDTVVELVGPNQMLRVLGWTARFGHVVVSGILNMSIDCPGFMPLLIPATRCLSFYSVSNDGIGDEDAGAAAVDIEPIYKEAIDNIESGRWRQELFVDKVYSLKDIGLAHEYADNNRATGKIAILID
ncbi:hypothetical protein FZEAL_1024 [Fusarium zealandicum]|uniref:Enoyl reductase (ER) domain-containing protein n=1 Tax=Fusarium zealandicum TaxID=1053134 RepID=A0A8H4UUA8_9HYPO|nr:hypothetical protein FZEAL_1024 [Fusarium zealandicum]